LDCLQNYIAKPDKAFAWEDTSVRLEDKQA
jgi:hypothetical protein